MPAPTVDSDPRWTRLQAELRTSVDERAWATWLAELRPVHIEGGLAVCEAPDRIRPWVVARFGRLLDMCAKEVLGPDGRIELVAPEAAESSGSVTGPPRSDRASRQRPGERAGAKGASTPSWPAPAPPPATPLDPRLTFDGFVIGDSNRLAHAAALTVAEMPGLAYNPLFICGPPGLGKTHLLHSIGNYVSAYGDGMSVRYTTVESFTNRFVGALNGGDLEAFKHEFRGVDVLLVDDVQFLERKARTEEEFFHTFNALQAVGSQLVLTSDRPPRDLAGLEDRLRERFEAGLVTEVNPPDLGTRLTVLRKRVHQDELRGVEPQALQVIAERVHRNLRTLEGALIRVVAFGSLTGRPVTAELAREVLDGLYPELRPARRTVDEIQERAAAAFGLTREELLSTGRRPELVWARQVAMYLARELTEETLPAIGRAFGGRNHTTVMHAHRRASARIVEEPAARELVERLTRELGAPGIQAASEANPRGAADNGVSSDADRGA